jgi:hypothetical protein
VAVNGTSNCAATAPPIAASPPPPGDQERIPNSDIDYIPPPPPGDEEARLRMLRAMSILDTEQEDRFSSITKLVCSVFDVPIAAVSLVDSDKLISNKYLT